MRDDQAEIQLRLGGREHVFRAGREIVVGRDAAADVQSENPYVSKKHARIRFENGTWILEDTGSKRGVFHRGTQVSRLELTAPTEVWLGPQNQGDRLELAPRVGVAAPPTPTPTPTPRRAHVPRGRPRAVGEAEIQLRLGGREYTFPASAPVVVGRDPAADVPSENNYVSKRHARIWFEGGTWVLEDLGSKRGVFQDGAPVSRVELGGPTEVWLGPPNQGDRLELKPRVAAAPPTPVAPGAPMPVAVPTADGSGEIRLRLGGSDYAFPAGTTVVLGRDPSADVQSENNYVSKQHARLRFENGTWVLEDTGSKRGVFHDGAPVSRVEITEPTEVWLGPPNHGERLELTPRVGAAGISTIIRDLKRSTRRTVAVAAAIVLIVVGGAAAAVVMTRGDGETRTGGGGGGGTDTVVDNGQLDLVALKKGAVLLAGKDGGGSGSGTIISKDGLILTNAHVAAITNPPAPGLGAQYGGPPEGASSAQPMVVYMTGGTDEPAQPTYLATQVVADGYLDLAVFKIDKTVTNEPVDPATLDLPFVPLGDSDELTAGDPITVFGFPGNAGTTAVSVDPGSVRSFVEDERLDTARAWINFSADIAHGNSGGLAADDQGRIVGIPTRFGDDTGQYGDLPARRLRPINLALPLIEAAKNGTQYDQYRFVKALTGTESMQVAGWAARDSEQCQDETVQSYPTEAPGLFPQLRYTGMSPGIDVLLLLIGPDPEGSGKPAKVGEAQLTWPSDAGAEGCVVLPFAPQQQGATWPDGPYVLAVLLGPNFEKTAGEFETAVGGAGSEPGTDTGGTSTTASPGTNPQPDACPSFEPSLHRDTGFDLPQVTTEDGDVVARAGRAGLAKALGDVRGYESAEEADAAALQGVAEWLTFAAHPSANAVTVFATSNARWLVVEHASRYYAFEGVIWTRQVLDANQRPPAPEGYVPAPDYALVPNPNPEPCVISSEEAALAGWHALDYAGEPSERKLQRYDSAGESLTPVS